VSNNLEQARELMLVVRTQVGDEAALEELMRLYSQRLRSYVGRMLGGQRENEDDLLQDIWVAVFRALPKLNDPVAFRTWLFRIAHDRVCREFRRRRLPFDSFEATDAELSAPPEDPGHVDKELVQRGLHTLSSEHREAIVLRFMEGMSYDEIAQATGTSPGTVRSRIHYAKHALRRAFERDMP
jgi:RNA polymerase sigma-70 factor (ECF subfamily)